MQISRHMHKSQAEGYYNIQNPSTTTSRASIYGCLCNAFNFGFEAIMKIPNFEKIQNQGISIWMSIVFFLNTTHRSMQGLIEIYDYMFIFFPFNETADIHFSARMVGLLPEYILVFTD